MKMSTGKIGNGNFFGNVTTFKLEDLIGKTLTIVKLDCAIDNSSITAAYDIHADIMYVLKVSVKVPKGIIDEYKEVMR